MSEAPGFVEKVYAVAETVPADLPYFTAGKLYEVLDENREEAEFRILTDNGLSWHFYWGANRVTGITWARVESPSPTKAREVSAEQIRTIIGQHVYSDENEYRGVGGIDDAAAAIAAMLSSPTPLPEAEKA